MTPTERVRTWSALIIGDNSGLLAAPGHPWEGHAERYERLDLVPKSELEERDIELRATAMALNECRRLIRQLLKHRGHVAADLVMDRMAAMMDRD